ncbi:MAG: DUF934 domain-containing protein [Myxococcales bacterium]|nr:DUF934 domain-containing protein [Myxococcales bacterium]MCB9731456.1 DUF934 domain-containing protein [Deltaproteobacteria bacterium]
MAEQMILDGRVVPRRWTLLDGAPADGVVAPGSILPCHDWQALRAAGADLTGVGLSLEGDCDIKALREVLGEVPVIALHIPKFTDGRCYTHARRIRHHWGYEGDVLVYGDVLRDQLVYLWRVGVNAFHMRQDQDLHASLGAFRLYSAFYQYGPLGSHAPRGERAA